MLQRKHVATATDARIQEQTFHRRQVPLRLGSQAVIRWCVLWGPRTYLWRYSTLTGYMRSFKLILSEW
jgi:hypothetical protein